MPKFQDVTAHVVYSEKTLKMRTVDPSICPWIIVKDKWSVRGTKS